MRDDIREANAELVEVLRELIAVLTSPGYVGGDDDTTGDNTGGGLDPVDVDPAKVVILPPPVHVYIYNTGAVNSSVQSNSPIN